MPEISRFYGISIYLYPNEHPPAHFHAEYQDDEAVFSIATLELMEGSLGNRANALVLEWASLHRVQLVKAWNELPAGRHPGKIEPLS
jgi:hypothetical protein